MQVALDAVTKAADLCIRVRKDMVNPNALEKKDKSPVTIADFGAQALVCEHLGRHFPGDVIVGEEDSSDLQKPSNAPLLVEIIDYVQTFLPDATPDLVCRWIDAGNGVVSDYFWTLDPIDGTKGFLRNAQYAIALALISGGEVKLGALACPAMPYKIDDPNSPKGVVFVAVRGEGAQMAPLHSDDFTTIQVVDGTNPTQMRFVESVESSHGNQPLQEAIAAKVGFSQSSLKMDSQVKYGALARGDAALYLRLPSPNSPDYREKIWDHAAGSLIVEEAGGIVTDMHGNPLDFNSDYKMRQNRGVIVGNRRIHASVLEAVAQIEVA